MKNKNFKKKSFFLVAGIIIVTAGFALFANANLFQGNLSMRNVQTGAAAQKLVDNFSYDGNFAGDPDFDGVSANQDKCADFPAYQIFRFAKNDFTTFNGQKIQLINVGTDEKGMVMNFKIGGRSFGAHINDPGEKPTLVQDTGISPTFTIRGLFGTNSPEDEAIVVLSSDAKVDPSTGCAVKKTQPQELNQNSQIDQKSKSNKLQQ